MVDHLRSRVTPWHQYESHVRVRGTLLKMDVRYNSTYKSRGWVWNDPDVIPIEAGIQLCYLIERLVISLLGIKPYS